MTRRWTTKQGIALAVLGALVGSGCSDEGVRANGSAATIDSAGSSDSSDSSGTLTAADTSSTSADTSGSSTTDGTTGAPMRPGHTQGQLVNVGEHMSSESYEMVFTLGQPSQTQATHASANYRLQGGLIGASGSPP